MVMNYHQPEISAMGKGLIGKIGRMVANFITASYV
jgi:hypothetical protein